MVVGGPRRPHQSAHPHRVQQRGQDQDEYRRRKRHGINLRPPEVPCRARQSDHCRAARGDRAPPGREPFHRMRMLVQAMDEELEAGRPGARAVAEDLASALFIMMLRGHFDQAACPNNLMKLLVAPPSARAVTAMLMAPARAWTLDALAVEARVSRATLVRIFRKAAGLAPLAFLSELRLELARHRLASTNVSLAKLAAEVGYDSESSFARAFRRRFGVSPGRSRSSSSGD